MKRLITGLILVTSLVLASCAPSASVTPTTPTPPASHIPDDLALRPYVHFVRLVAEGTRVSPDTADLPLRPTPTPDLFNSKDRLELVFFMEAAARGSVRISEDKRGGSIVFSQEWYLSDETGIVWLNLMRPPGVTLRENHIPYPFGM